MAIYHMSVKIGQRSAGQSSVASAAYRSGDELFDERTGQDFDYKRKGGIAASGILASEDAPSWTRDRARLWNVVEKAEKRKDAQVYREFEAALPSELTREQQLELVAIWVDRELISRGMIADVNMHDTGKGNPHVHIMATTRRLAENGEGFGAKERAWNDKALLKEWRQSWGAEVNQSLERAGHETRVDHRSHRERGIAMEPQLHHGNRSRLRAKNDEIIARNVERIQLPQQAAELVAIAEARAEQEQPRQAAERERKHAEMQAHFEAQLREFERAKAVREQTREATEAKARAKEEAEQEAQRTKAEEVAREKARQEREAAERAKAQARDLARAERATIDVPLAHQSERYWTMGVAAQLAAELNQERIQLRREVEASEARGRIAKFLKPTNPEAFERLKVLDAKVEYLWGLDRFFKQGGQRAREDDLRAVPELVAKVEHFRQNHALAVKYGLVKSEEQLRQEARERAQTAAMAPAKAKAKTQEKVRTQNKDRSGPDRGGHGMGGGSNGLGL
jgi:hypothetical protein